MYRPAPQRPKKTSIVRTRTGCRNCRARRKKCDERRPACGACTRLGKHCDGYATKLEFRNVSFIPNDHQGFSKRLEGSPTQSQKDNCGRSPSHDSWRGQYTISPSRSSVTEGEQYVKEASLSRQTPTADLMLEIDRTNLNEDGGDMPTTNYIDLVDSETSASLPLVTTTIRPRVHSPVSSQSYDGEELRMYMDLSPSKDYFYLGLWGTQCAPALHPIFNKLAGHQSLSPVIEDTMKAQAARQLSRMLPRARDSGSLDVSGSSFRPDLDQQSISWEFSSSAMRSVAKWNREDFQRDPTTALAVLILFCYLESLTSNFQGFYLHSNAIETLMKNMKGGGTELVAQGAELLTAWVQSKMHNWWRRFHFGTPAFQRDHPSLTLHPMMTNILAKANSNRVSVLMILCESYRLNAATFMYNYKGTENARTESDSTNSHPAPTPSSAFLNTQKEQLSYQRAALNEWYSRIPGSELPVDFSVDSETYFRWDSSESIIVEPLPFQSHEAAMNFAYYVTARVMQCTEFLGAPQMDSKSMTTEASFNTAEPWITLLCRIAVGIDWESCTRLNTYTIGLSGLLLACVLRSHRSSIGLWVENWLNQRYQDGSLEEGSFPIFQILQILRIINQERRLGRYVYAVCQPIDDGGGAGKFDSYNSQKLVSLLVYGRCMESNCLYSRNIDLKSFSASYRIRQSSSDATFN